MSLYNDLSAKVQAALLPTPSTGAASDPVENTDGFSLPDFLGGVGDALTFGVGSVLGNTVQSTLSGLGGGGEFADAMAAIAGNYANNYGGTFVNDLLGSDVIDAIGTGTGALSDALGGDYNHLGVRLLEYGLADSLIPGLQAILAQARYWRAPTPLFGGISPTDARAILRETQGIAWHKNNLFLVEISLADAKQSLNSPPTRFNLYVTGVEYAPQSLVGDAYNVGAAVLSGVKNTAAVELKITTLDDQQGTIKTWFKNQCALSAHPDGTVGVPLNYVCQISVLYGVSRKLTVAPYETIGWFKPTKLEAKLTRASEGMEELTLSFLQTESFRSAHK